MARQPPHTRIKDVTPAGTPEGYQILYGESRGYDSPDKWYEAHYHQKPIGRSSTLGYSSVDEAVAAATEHAAARQLTHTKCLCCRRETLRPFPFSDFSWCTYCGTIQGIVDDVLQIEIPDAAVQELNLDQHEKFKAAQSDEPISIFRTTVEYTDITWTLGIDENHFNAKVDDVEVALFKSTGHYTKDGNAAWHFVVTHEPDELPHICTVEGVAETLAEVRAVAAKTVFRLLKDGSRAS